ncbi:ribonuclease CAF1 [Gorgonomyces haynaldii]|nr:ribonuclease CAF1 [Gorgonomyces haynaldii]
MEVPNFTNVNRHNIEELHLSIRHRIQQADFIALDTEFTGFGDHKQSTNPNIEQRYQYLTEIATTRAICAFGVSVFVGTKVTNLMFNLLANTTHTIEPKSMSFLATHGFDFNDQFLNAIPFTPAQQNDIVTNQLMRDIFMEIVQKKCPVIVHNGFLDLMFLYQSFFGPLPKQLPTFIADLTWLFPKIVDTKYISDYVVREPISFLSFLYKRYQRLDLKQNRILDIQGELVHKHTPSKRQLHEYGLAPKLSAPLDTGKPYCEQFAAHGVCQSGIKCQKSHDLDLILDTMEGKRPTKKQKQDPSRDGVRQDPKRFEVYHSACFDAYMTGYLYWHQKDRLDLTCMNKVYLIGKQMPLAVEKSIYSNYSKNVPTHQ